MLIDFRADKILNMLQSEGHEALVVGGCVRDMVLGLTPHDWDICTSALPEEVKAVAKSFDIEVVETGIKHGTVSLIMDNEPYEVTTYRVDGEYTDSRHPDSVEFTTSLKEDLSRRDFTMNAMAYSYATGIIDPFGGQEDIKAHIIRAVGDAQKRFNEDALRILRAVRFEATYGFNIEEKTHDAMVNCRGHIKYLARERVGSEFIKIICGANAVMAIRENERVLGEVVPELNQTVCCWQNNQYHIGDVYTHTMLAMEAAEGKDTVFGEADKYVKLALFFHDIGKPFCKVTDEMGYDHFYGHPKLSGNIAWATMNNLRFDEDTQEKVEELVRFHDVEFTPTKVCAKRLLNKLGEEQVKRLIKLRECDMLAHSAKAYPLIVKAIKFSMMVDEVIAEQDCFQMKDLAVNGKDLIAIGYKPGPELGEVLNLLLTAVIENVLKNDKEGLLDFAKGVLRDE